MNLVNKKTNALRRTTASQLVLAQGGGEAINLDDSECSAA